MRPDRDAYFRPERVPDPWKPDVGAWVRRQAYLGRSASTVATWGRSIMYFAIWLKEQDRLAGVEAVRGSDIEEWLTALRATRKGNTQVTYYSGLKSFFAYLVEEGITPTNPMARLKPPSVDDAPDPEVLMPEYVRALLEAANGNSFYATRDKALIRFLLESGGRNSEVLSMRIDRLDQSGRSAIVQRKGGGERTVRYGDEAAYLLDRYLHRRSRHPQAKLPNLWVGKLGAIKRDAVNVILKKRASEAGLPTHLHAHLFRHTWADSLKRSDVSDEALRALGGWSERSPVPLRYGRKLRNERAVAELDAKRPFDRFS